MSDKIKDYIVIITFALMIFGTILINTSKSDSEILKELKPFSKILKEKQVHWELN